MGSVGARNNPFIVVVIVVVAVAVARLWPTQS
jgi:hypothetical protein